MDLRTGRLAGAEALLRWNDPVLGFVPPTIAVPVAESSGLIDRLTLWVVTSAVQRCRGVSEDTSGIRGERERVAVQPARGGFAVLYRSRSATWEVQGSSLTVEITETAMMSDQNAANEALHQLKSHGVRLSIDDFGIGYSSMYYLAQLPLDEVKIDLLFVKNMLEVPHHFKIVRSLIDLAHNLELSVVAEGVENEPS